MLTFGCVLYVGINPKNSARKDSLGRDWLSKSPGDIGKPRNTQLASLGKSSYFVEFIGTWSVLAKIKTRVYMNCKELEITAKSEFCFAVKEKTDKKRFVNNLSFLLSCMLNKVCEF